MDKQAETRKIRRELMRLYLLKLELIESQKVADELQDRIDALSIRVVRLEESMSKNIRYRAIDMRIEQSNPVIGRCIMCGKKVSQENKYQIRDEEGLFDTRYCRDRYRAEKAKKKAVV